MSLPANVVERLHKVGDVVGLRFSGDRPAGKVYYLRVLALDLPADQHDFSLGSASGLAVAGTAFQTITNSSSIRLLEPPSEYVLYQIFYGIAPSYARVYRQFPSGVLLGGLPGTQAIGSDAIGYIDGIMSPYNSPGPISELHTVKGIYPAFLGYHPYAEPTSVTVFMNFFISTYSVEDLTADVDRSPDSPATRALMALAKTYNMGGRQLATPPSWLVQAGTVGTVLSR